MLQYADELQALWDNALVGAVHNQQGNGNKADSKNIKTEKIFAEDENNGNQNTELLAGREVSAVGGSGNSVWEQGGNSAKLARYLEQNSELEGKIPERCRAGESGWILQKNLAQSGESGRIVGLLRRISRVEPSVKEYAWFMEFIDNSRSVDGGNYEQSSSVFNQVFDDVKTLMVRSFEDYDEDRICRKLLQLIQDYDENAILYRFDRDSRRFIKDFQQRGQGNSGSGIHKNSRNATSRAGLSLGNQQKVQGTSRTVKNERVEITEDEVISQSKRAMAAELTRLRELLKMQGRESHGTLFTKSSVDLVAAELIEKADSRLTKAELAPLLQKLYARIASDKELNFEDVMDEARGIADKINENYRPTKERVKIWS